MRVKLTNGIESELEGFRPVFGKTTLKKIRPNVDIIWQTDDVGGRSRFPPVGEMAQFFIWVRMC